MNTKTMKYELPQGVELDVIDYDIEREDRQDSAFYTWSDTNLVARLSYKGREFGIYCVGEMRIHYKDQVIRYCNDLVEAGFTNDKELAQLEDKGGEWINNSWFEVYDYNSDEYTMEIYHEVKEAIESVANWITEEVK
jgi:hypothetical protein